MGDHGDGSSFGLAASASVSEDLGGQTVDKWIDYLLALLAVLALAATLMAHDPTRPRHTSNGTNVSWAVAFDTFSLDRDSP